MTGREIHLDVPAEPGPNGIVTDREGRAWQRRDGDVAAEQPGELLARRWLCVVSLGWHQALTWPELVATRGDLFVHYEGDTEPPHADFGDAVVTGLPSRS